LECGDSSPLSFAPRSRPATERFATDCPLRERMRRVALECGDSSPLSFAPRSRPATERFATDCRCKKESGDESPHSKEEETGTGTFNAANWAVWDASDLRDGLGSICRDYGTQLPQASAADRL